MLKSNKFISWQVSQSVCLSPSAPGFDEIAGGPWNCKRLYSAKASFSPTHRKINLCIKIWLKELDCAINAISVEYKQIYHP